jgi:hypothetical protein
MPGEAEAIGRPDLSEMRELLSSRGWTVLDAQRHELVLNDVRSVDPDAETSPTKGPLLRRPEPGPSPPGARRATLDARPCVVELPLDERARS